MPCYRIHAKVSSMPSDFVGAYTKYAHDEAAALDCLAKKNASYSKKTNTAVDSKGNTLTVISIEAI
jgi:hypothetical protein